MKSVTFVTGNEAKYASAQRHLRDFGIDVRKARINDFPEPRSDDVGEIARYKALYASETMRMPLITNDSGFYIPAWNGWPGPYVNYSLSKLGINGILKLMSGMGLVDSDGIRACEFRESVAYIDKGMQEPVIFNAVMKGSFSKQPRGTRQGYHWSDLALIFVPEGYDRTLGEFTESEYEEFSRGKNGENSSFLKFGRWYIER